MKNGLQQENFHELNRWKPPVRLIPFDPTRLARLPYPVRTRDEELVESESGGGPNIDRQPQCDDEDGQCGESVEESSGDGFEVETATRLPSVLAQPKVNLTKSIDMLETSNNHNHNTNSTIRNSSAMAVNVTNVQPNIEENAKVAKDEGQSTSIYNNVTSAREEAKGHQACDGRECNKEENPKLYNNGTNSLEINRTSNQSDLTKSSDEYGKFLNDSSIYSTDGNSSEHNTTFTPIATLKSTAEHNLTGTAKIPSRLNSSSLRHTISLRVTSAAEQSSTRIEVTSSKWTTTMRTGSNNTIRTTPRSRNSLLVRIKNETRVASWFIRTTKSSYLASKTKIPSSLALQKVYDNSAEKYEGNSCKNIFCESGGVCRQHGRNNGRCLCPIGKGGIYCEKGKYMNIL